MRVPLFRSAHEGFGHSRRLNRRNVYNRVFGSMWPLIPGELRLGHYWSAVNHSAGFTNPPIAAHQWEDSSSNPLVLIVGDDKIKKMQYGAAAAADSTLTTTATGSCLHDDGSGVPYLYVGFGGDATGSKMQRRNRAATLTAMTNLVAKKLASVGGDLYGTRIPSGGTNACAVWKIAAGTSITAAIALPSGSVVGRANTEINNLCGLGRSIISLKPEGIFIYDRAADAWVNKAPMMEFHPHQNNGKVFWYEDGALVVALGDGGAVRFDGEDVTPYDLVPPDALPNSDTPQPILSCAASLRTHGLAVTKMGHGKGQRFGVRRSESTFSSSPMAPVFAKSTDSGATWSTDYTNEITDRSPASVATLDALVAGTGMALLGCAEPICAFEALLASGNRNTNANTLTIEYWDGSAWTVVANVLDGTVAGGSLGKSGIVIILDDLLALGWTTKAETIPSRGSVTAYYLRLSWSANMSATVRPHTVNVFPFRPMIDGALSGAGTLGYDGLDRAGVLPHVLLSARDQYGFHITHDIGTMSAQSGAIEEMGCAIMANVAGTAGDDAIYAPVVFGAARAYYPQSEAFGRQAYHRWPWKANPSLIELAAIDLEQELDKDGPFSVDGFYIDGEDWSGTGYLYARFVDDEGPWARVAVFDSLPVNASGGLGARRGRVLQLVVAVVLQATERAGLTKLTRIDGEIEVKADEIVRKRQRQAQPVV